MLLYLFALLSIKLWFFDLIHIPQALFLPSWQKKTLASNPVTSSSPEAGDDQKQPKDINHVERVLSDGLKKDEADYSRMDKDLQEYVARGQVDVDEATSKRLKRMIDRRVLIIMILTYFLQALDKGTLSFASIMGIRTDLHLQNGQKVTLVFPFSLGYLL